MYIIKFDIHFKAYLCMFLEITASMLIKITQFFGCIQSILCLMTVVIQT